MFAFGSVVLTSVVERYISGVSCLFNYLFDVCHGERYIHTRKGGYSDWRLVGLFGGMGLLFNEV